MRLVDVPDDLILEVASQSEVLEAYSLSVSCRRFRELALNEVAYWSTLLINQQKAQPSQILPLPPYQDIKELSITQLHVVVVHMVNLEKNLSKKRATLRHPPTQVMIDGLKPYGGPDNIPGTPLVLLQCSDDQVACVNYEQRELVCAVKAPHSFMQRTSPYHERGRCSRVLEVGLTWDVERALYMLQVDYHHDPLTNQWQASMELLLIPTPEENLDGFETPKWDAEVTTDSKMVAYIAARHMLHVDEDGNRYIIDTLEVVVLNAITGAFTRICTGIDLNPHDLFSMYRPILKDRHLFLLLEKSQRTHIWQIPDSLLPFDDGRIVEPDSDCLLGPDNDIGHRHGGSVKYCPHFDAQFDTDTGSESEDPDATDKLTEEDIYFPETWLRESHTLYGSIQSTFSWIPFFDRETRKAHQALQLRCWSLPGSDVDTAAQAALVANHRCCNTDITAGASVTWEERHNKLYASASSLLWISPDDPAELILARYHAHDLPARVSYHVLELPEELKPVAVLRQVRVSFDDGLGVVLFMMDDGRLWVLKYA
ncbi:hypothetical protein V5O48_015241 [Marasmius crinis-equi]|uniref:F-box domain-containing protein n=1 Tax=Marasmius crinis-equi TaxID=585013 RepID=A0ABR3EV33_9AGAR